MNMIGIDLGTTGCKSMIFNDQGEILAERYAEYELDHTSEGYIEQDAEIWWILVQQVIRECVSEAGANAARDVRGVSVSSQGISFVPVDESGHTLAPAISWLDNRSVEQTRQIRQFFSESEIFTRTGKRISPAYTLPKLMWLKQHKPSVYNKATRFLLPLDFITERLTGVVCTDYAMASGTMAFNIRTGLWDDLILQTCGIDRQKLPPVAVTGSRVGTLKPAVARSLGLPDSVAVFLGTQDQKCAALAAGIEPGVATISLGTASAITTMSHHPILDQAMRIPCFALGADRWVLESVIGTASVTLKWLRKTMMPDLNYSEMDELAEQAPIGSNGVQFYPHFEGAGSPFWRSDLRGSYQGLSLAASRNDIIRALLEGIAFQIKTNLLVQEDITGIPIHTIRIFGGGSKSDLWCAIIAAVSGIPVEQMEAEIANLGAGLLALQALTEGEARGIEALTKPICVFEPDPLQHDRYQPFYTTYRQTENIITQLTKSSGK